MKKLIMSVAMVFVAIGMVMLVSPHGKVGAQQACVSDDDCDNALVCNDGVCGGCNADSPACEQHCTASASCTGQNQLCIQQRCIDACPADFCDNNKCDIAGQVCNPATCTCEGACNENIPCPTGQICQNGECVVIEECDGFDNDQDGQVDENCPPCEEVKDCAGNAVCNDNNVCAPPPDCDPNGADSCDLLFEGQNAVCLPVDDGPEGLCCVPVGEEVCNDRDDDCDGAVNEELNCDDVCQPTEEVCDGADNDCDGAIDEDGVCPTCDADNPCAAEGAECGEDGVCVVPVTVPNPVAFFVRGGACTLIR